MQIISCFSVSFRNLLETTVPEGSRIGSNVNNALVNATQGQNIFSLVSAAICNSMFAGSIAALLQTLPYDYTVMVSTPSSLFHYKRSLKPNNWNEKVHFHITEVLFFLAPPVDTSVTLACLVCLRPRVVKLLSSLAHQPGTTLHTRTRNSTVQETPHANNSQARLIKPWTVISDVTIRVVFCRQPSIRTHIQQGRHSHYFKEL